LHQSLMMSISRPLRPFSSESSDEIKLIFSVSFYVR